MSSVSPSPATEIQTGDLPRDNNPQEFWNGFTKFLKIVVVSVAAALLLIGLFTVWS
ncbi:MAG TPA: hypothetical protein PLI12_03225 [Acetobacteraceae bacterium]|jgi:hypothetical protein|nr:hypothetical protein [Acetobacteraceae bacterium]HQU01442.1 hypothetical protein [Acetobacteraceae bacterium]